MRTLIIEDDYIWQCKLQIIAEKAGLDVITIAESVTTAKQSLELEKPDLIITDIHLQNGTIFSLFKDKSIQKIPTIFTSVSDSKTDFKKAAIAQNHMFLVKPFHHHTLLSAISNLNQKNNKPIEESEFRKEIMQEIHLRKDFLSLLNSNDLLQTLNIGARETKIIQKRWVENKTYQEIGKEFGLSKEAVRMIFIRGLQKLKVKLSNHTERFVEYLNFMKSKKSKMQMIALNTEVIKLEKNPQITALNKEIFIDDCPAIETKIKNILVERHIKTLQDLAQYSKRELLRFKGLGAFVVTKLELVLAEHGLQLKH